MNRRTFVDDVSRGRSAILPLMHDALAALSGLTEARMETARPTLGAVGKETL